MIFRTEITLRKTHTRTHAGQRETERQWAALAEFVAHSGRSDFDTEVVLLVSEFENKRPRKLTDARLFTVNQQTSAIHANSYADQLRVLNTRQYTRSTIH